MKRFLSYCLIVLVLIVATASGYEAALRSIPNDYKYKNQWLSQNANNIKIAILGSSHAYYDFNPAYFNQPAFNMAHVSQSLQYDAWLYDRFLSNSDSLQYLILTMSYFSLVTELENSIEWWRAKNYAIYYDCPIHSHDLKYNLLIYGDRFRGFKRLVQCLTNDNPVISDSLGWGTNHRLADRLPIWKEKGIIAAERHTVIPADTQLVNVNKNFVHKILDQALERNVQVFLVTTPCYHTYTDNLNSAQLNEMIRFCRQCAFSYPNVRYFNYLTDIQLPLTEDDYYDADHLNEKGAAIISAHIASELISEYF